MEYNICKTCGAGDGRAGNLINDECLNCHDTRKTGDVVVHANLNRTEDELKATMAILKMNEIPNGVFLSAAGLSTKTINGAEWWCIPTLEHESVVPVREADDYSLEYLMSILAVAANNKGYRDGKADAKENLIERMTETIRAIEQDETF